MKMTNGQVGVAHKIDLHICESNDWHLFRFNCLRCTANGQIFRKQNKRFRAQFGGEQRIHTVTCSRIGIIWALFLHMLTMINFLCSYSVSNFFATNWKSFVARLKTLLLQLPLPSPSLSFFFFSARTNQNADELKSRDGHKRCADCNWLTSSTFQITNLMNRSQKNATTSQDIYRICKVVQSHCEWCSVDERGTVWIAGGKYYCNFVATIFAKTISPEYKLMLRKIDDNLSDHWLGHLKQCHSSVLHSFELNVESCKSSHNTSDVSSYDIPSTRTFANGLRRPKTSSILERVCARVKFAAQWLLNCVA